jgi:hypothetical protein
MQSPAEAIEKVVLNQAETFATSIASTSGSDRNLQEAVLKMAIRDVCWALLEAFPDEKYELADMLELMAGLVREHKADA